jgi:iduronate 2-sulfatase
LAHRPIIQASLAIGFGLLVSGLPAQDTPERPNVLFIAVDDLRAELGCYDAPHIISPNLDALAERGVLFERAYCALPVCGPSRVSVLTGLRPDTIGIHDLYTHHRDRIPDIVTLPQLFKNNGYIAQGIGKIFHNSHQPDWRGDEASWSVPAQISYGGHDSDKPVVKGAVPPNLSDVPRTEMRDVPDDAYFEGRVANLAIEALDQLKGEPFFLAVGFWKPHLPFNAPKRYWDMYDTSTLPPVQMPDRPEGAPEMAFHPSVELMREFQGDLTPEQVTTLRHGYYAATTYMDSQLGRVIDHLDELGLADNTIIVVWSDHGYHLGEHGMWTKLSAFEADLRVPFIIADPRTTTAGSRAAGPVELLDIYPTLADLCGLPPPHKLDGVSLRPMLNDPTVHARSFAYSQSTHPKRVMPKGTVVQAMGYTMRSLQYRYTEWRSTSTGEVLHRELYDYSGGWFEERNIAHDPQNAALVASMSESMKEAFPLPKQ